MKEAIRQRARELGFDDCRVSSAAAPDSAPRFQKWLEQRFHGEMGYMERNAGKRTEPHRVLGGVRSVIALAVSYETRSVQSDNTAREAKGVIARYARYTDYHDVLGERLKL